MGPTPWSLYGHSEQYASWDFGTPPGSMTGQETDKRRPDWTIFHFRVPYALFFFVYILPLLPTHENFSSLQLLIRPSLNPNFAPELNPSGQNPQNRECPQRREPATGAPKADRFLRKGPRSSSHTSGGGIAGRVLATASIPMEPCPSLGRDFRRIRSGSIFRAFLLLDCNYMVEWDALASPSRGIRNFLFGLLCNQVTS